MREDLARMNTTFPFLDIKAGFQTHLILVIVHRILLLSHGMLHVSNTPSNTDVLAYLIHFIHTAHRQQSEIAVLLRFFLCFPIVFFKI